MNMKSRAMANNPIVRKLARFAISYFLLIAFAIILIVWAVVGIFVSASPSPSVIELLSNATVEDVELTQLTSSPDRKSDLAWSPDSTKLAYVRWYKPEICVIDIMWQTEQQITHWDGWGNSGLRLHSYSSNGSELYIYTMDDLWAIPVNGNEKRQITHYDGTGIYNERFRSGKAAYFSGGYPTELRVVGLNTASTSKLLASDLEHHLYSSLDLSPDGEEIVYSAGILGTRDPQYPNKPLRGMWVINADGTNKRQISNQGGSQLRWNPNGSNIAFLRDNELWFIKPYGTGEEKVFTQSHHIKYYKWNNDGSKIAYWASQTKNGQCTSLWIIDLVADTETRVMDTAGTGVFGEIYSGGNNMAWNPDGDIIALMTSGSAGEQVLLLNLRSNKPQSYT